MVEVSTVDMLAVPPPATAPPATAPPATAPDTGPGALAGLATPVLPGMVRRSGLPR